MIYGPRGRKEIVRKAVQIMNDMGSEIFAPRKFHRSSLGTTAYGAGKVKMGCSGMSARKDEGLEGLKNGIMTVDPTLNHPYMLFGDPGNTVDRRRIQGCRQIRTEGKQSIRNGFKLLPQTFRNFVHQHHTEDGGQLINRAIGLYAQVGLVNACAPEQCRCAVIAGFGINACCHRTRRYPAKGFRRFAPLCEQ
jgi:hypothetical protein